jgi:hypothetical protein
MNNRFILLTLLFAIVFSCVGCIFFDIYREQQEIEKLPYLEYDGEGNIIYNEGIYRLENVEFYSPYGFLSSKFQPIAQEEYWGVPGAVFACGKEDFGEHVYISVFHSDPGGREYLKSDFVFPNYMTETFSKILIRRNPSSTKTIDLSKYLTGNHLTLGDLITPCDMYFQQNTIAHLYLDVYFTNYQTIYLSCAHVFIYNEQVYVRIADYKNYSNGASLNTYRVNDQYQELFKNAIAELSE